MLNTFTSPDQYWLPFSNDIGQILGSFAKEPSNNFQDYLRLLNYRLNFLQLNRLSEILSKNPEVNEKFVKDGLRKVRVAILSSATVDHLVPAIKISLMRRGLMAEIYTHTFGQYLQELNDPSSGLIKFNPNIVLISFDSEHVLKNSVKISTVDRKLDLSLSKLFFTNLWEKIRNISKCQIIQQTCLPTQISLIGSIEYFVENSSASHIEKINFNLKDWAKDSGVDLLCLDRQVQRTSLSVWHERGLWNYSKQDTTPQIAPLYGDLVSRVVAASAGLSRKCLVMDLDNTIWGGVIGDDGLGGIKIGNGDALGEAYLAFQKYILELSAVGIILAVCSKNDLNKALEPFQNHPDMLLKKEDIACFIANWNDKPSNIREIASQLNIGLDSLVFVDDNPFEREFVRKELPMVFVPELPNDPAYYAQCISDSGCFDRVSLTEDDKLRAKQYSDNAIRSEFASTHENITDYLVGLEMRLQWGIFSEESWIRCAQLINKTNQFNITGSRYLDDEIKQFMCDRIYKCAYFRLFDKFGDNGIISAVIMREIDANLIFIDTWVMSCRVFGRNTEHAIFQVLVNICKNNGYKKLASKYCNTGKNTYVSDLFERLGFINTRKEEDSLTYFWEFDLTQTIELNKLFIIEPLI